MLIHLRSRRYILPTLGVIFTIPLIIYLSGLVFSRHMADDFCVLNVLREQGPLPAFVYYYFNWTGRFVSTILLFSGLLSSTAGASLIMAAFLIIWWVATFQIVRFVARVRHWPQPAWAALVATSLFILTVFNSMFSLVQNVYWVSAIFVYLAPVVFLVLYIWFLTRQSEILEPPLPKSIAFPLAVILPVLAAGCLEIVGLIQVAGMILLYLWGTRRAAPRRLLPYLLVSLASAIVTLVVTILAPGNYVRMQAIHTHDILLTAVGSVLGPIINLGTVTLYWPLAPIVLLLLPALAGYFFEQGTLSSARRHLVSIAAVTYALMVLSFVIPFFATASPPPERAWIIPQNILFAGMSVCSYLFGWVVRSKKAPVRIFPGARFIMLFTAALLVLAFITSSLKAANTVGLLKAHADAWDRRDSELRARAGDPATIILAPLPEVGLKDMTDNPDFFANACTAQYYHVKAIQADPALYAASH